MNGFIGKVIDGKIDTSKKLTAQVPFYTVFRGDKGIVIGCVNGGCTKECILQKYCVCKGKV